jgi:thioredoxin 1
MAEVKAVSKDNFQAEVMDSDKTVIVDFWATWCAPCRQVNPVLTSIAEAHDELSVVKIDIDADREIAQQYNVLSVPTILVMRGGEVIKTVVGAKPKVVLERELLAGL